MSYPGRQALRHIERTWIAYQRSGRLHHDEIVRIRRGDHSPLRREHEPAFTAGTRHILAFARARTYYDELTGEVVRVPATPSMWVIVGKPVRKARGGWSVPLVEVVDHRERSRYIRRKPPVMTPGTERAESAAEAHEQSNYQHTPVGAVDELAAVDDDTLAVFAAEAQVKRLLADHTDTEAKLAAVKRLPERQRLNELRKLAESRGIDVRDDVRAFERRIRRRLGDAA